MILSRNQDEFKDLLSTISQPPPPAFASNGFMKFFLVLNLKILMLNLWES